MREQPQMTSRVDRLRRRRASRWRKLVVTVALAAALVTTLAVTFNPGDDGPPSVSAGSDSPTASDTDAAPGEITTVPAATGESESAEASSSTPTASPLSDGPTSPTWRGSGQPVTFAFGGDTHFESYLRPQLDADPTGMLAPIAPLLSAADVAVVNLESALTERGEPAAKEYTFRAPPSALTALASAGVDAVSLANNHGLDYGTVGIADALDASRATGVPVIGIGNDAAEAYRPFTTEVNGQRVAVIAATQVLDSAFVGEWTATDTKGGLASAKEVDRLVAAVEQARAETDTLVVFLHWGVSLDTCPSADQQDLARTLVDAGADIIVGGHSHRLEGAGYLDSAFVGYGLGNFIWYAQPGASSESGVLYVTAVGRDVESYSWHPAVISNGVPRPVDGVDAEQRLEEWNALRDCTGLSASPAA